MQLVAESEQIRREVDDSGPTDELDFWKRRVARFNYLLEQIKSAHVKAALNVLSVSKSKLLKVNRFFLHIPYFSLIQTIRLLMLSLFVVLRYKVLSQNKLFIDRCDVDFCKEWHSVDARVTEIINESRDNVKFLYILDKTCAPIYASNPVCCFASHSLNV